MRSGKGRWVLLVFEPPQLMDLGHTKTILRLRHHRVHLVRGGGDLLRRELQLRSRGLIRRLPRARRRLAVARPRGRRASRLFEFFEEGVEEERVAAEALDRADEDGGETEVLAARLKERGGDAG